MFRIIEGAQCNRASEDHGTDGDSTGKPLVLTMLPIHAEPELDRGAARLLNWQLLRFTGAGETAEQPVSKPMAGAG